MKYKRIKLIVMLVLGTGIIGLRAQTMYLNEIGDIQTSYALSSIRKMSFSSGNLTVIKNNNSSVVKTLSGLKNLSFKNYSTDISESANDNYVSLHTYPNPVQNILNIDVVGIDTADGAIRIYNLEGRLVYTQQFTGKSSISINMSRFTSGLYLCRYSDRTKTKTVKILKQ